jgi:hypothetical protein
MRDVSSARLEAAQSQLVDLFKSFRWAVEHSATLGKPADPHKNVTLYFSSKVNPVALNSIRDGFAGAGVEVSEQAENTDDVLPMIWLSAERS